jgi:hypothetical protein
MRDRGRHPVVPALGVCVLAVTAFLVSGPGRAGNPEDAVAELLLGKLQSFRGQNRLPLLRKVRVLEEIARERARVLAARAGEQPYVQGDPFERLMADHPALWTRRPVEHVSVVRGSGDPVHAALKSVLRRPNGGEILANPRVDGVGIATRRLEEERLLLVAIFLETESGHLDPGDVERRTLEWINEVRAREGLPGLSADRSLEEVARAHSADMAGRGFFAHESPEGLGPEDRVRDGGLAYELVAENLGKSLDMDDPVAGVVDGWLHSPGHRANIMDPRFDRTGVGVIVDGRGVLYFTQLFGTAPSDDAR